VEGSAPSTDQFTERSWHGRSVWDHNTFRARALGELRCIDFDAAASADGHGLPDFVHHGGHSHSLAIEQVYAGGRFTLLSSESGQSSQLSHKPAQYEPITVTRKAISGRVREVCLAAPEGHDGTVREGFKCSKTGSGGPFPIAYAKVPLSRTSNVRE
jgi:hypothetical protein